MAQRRMVNPKVLLLLGALVLLVSSAIAIFVAVGFTPEPRSRETAPATETSVMTVQPSTSATGVSPVR